MRIGKLIRQWRQIQEITTRELAKEIGISASTICRIENGEDIDSFTLLKLIHWVFGGELK